MSGRKSSIGFTSRTFASAAKKAAITLDGLIAWAAGQGFGWMEIRDTSLDLTEDALKRLCNAAAAASLRLHYAWDGTNILDPGDVEKLQRGVRNCSVFGPGTFARLTIAGHAIRDDKSRTGYRSGELQTLRERISQYVRIAQERKVRLVFENSSEPMSAAAKGEIGIRELLEAVPSMEMTFDPGNFMDRAHNRSWSTAEEIRTFYAAYSKRLPYVHVKMTRDNLVQPELIEDGDLDVGFFRRILAEGKPVCIELSEAEDLETCKQRVSSGKALLEQGASAV